MATTTNKTASSTTALRPSFGVELECLGCYHVLTPSTETEAQARAKYPGAIIVPLTRRPDADHACREEIVALLKKNGFDVHPYGKVIASYDPESSGNAAMEAQQANNRFSKINVATVGKYNQSSRNTKYQRWTVTEDLSIEANHEAEVKAIAPLKYFGFELISPAQPGKAESYEEVKKVVRLITRTFRCFVNWSTGFHVHVGVGPDLIPFKPLRRIAALCWAMDIVLSPLHPKDRHENAFMCRRNREWSKVAWGLRPDGSQDCTLEKPRGLLEGAKTIMQSQNSDVVARMMSCISRPAYTFVNYEDAYKSNFCNPNRDVTIEFRQAAGTMDPNWIETWATLCVRMCELAARDTDGSQVLDIVKRCAVAETSPKFKNAMTLKYLLGKLSMSNKLDYLRKTTPEQRSSIPMMPPPRAIESSGHRIIVVHPPAETSSSQPSDAEKKKGWRRLASMKPSCM